MFLYVDFYYIRKNVMSIVFWLSFWITQSGLMGKMTVFIYSIYNIIQCKKMKYSLKWLCDKHPVSNCVSTVLLACMVAAYDNMVILCSI